MPPLAEDRQEILAVRAVPDRTGQAFQLRLTDVTHAEGNFFRAADLESLPHVDGLDEETRLEKHVRRTRVQPRRAATEVLNPETSAGQVPGVHIGDLELAPSRRLETAGNLDHLPIEEVEPGHSVVRLRLGR